MLQAYKYRVKPSKAIEDKLNGRLEICRELYNAALQERREAYKLRGKSISYLEQANQLPAIKASREDVKGVHSQVLQDVLKRVDRAMEGFYRRVKKGERGGYPRYKGKSGYESFTYPQGGWKLEGYKLTLSKIGSMRVSLSRAIEGKVKTVTVYRSLTNIIILTEQDTLEAGDVVPGWKLAVKNLFG